MNILKSLWMALVAVSVCIAQSYNISGIVTDTGTTPLSGAVVKLEKAGLTAMSGADGRFTISGTIGIRSSLVPINSKNPVVTLRDDIVSLDLPKQFVVGVRIYSVQGRLLSKVQKTISAGRQSMPVPQKGTGVCLYRVKIGENEVVLRGTSLGQVSGGAGVTMTTHAVKQSVSNAAINDVIAVTNGGYLNYRVVVYKADTSNIQIKMIVCADTVRDIDGNLYQAVRIGSQVWTVENLRVTKYNDGLVIPLVTDSAAWSRIYDSSLTNPAYCFYQNTTNTDSIKKYGALYNWYAVGTKKLAPSGWHVPSDAERGTLSNYLIANGYNWDNTTTGNKISKSLAAKTDWSKNLTEGATGCDLTKNNKSGFSALPGGNRQENGRFQSKGGGGYWWSATDDFTLDAWFWDIESGTGIFYRDNSNSSCGFSVRLVKD